MGVLSYLISADADLPQKMSSLELGDIDRIGVDVKGLQTIELGTLWAILNNSEFDPDFLGNESDCVWTGPEGETWLFAIPPKFTEKVNALMPSSIPAIVEKWFATEEFQNQYAGYTKEMVGQYLDEICLASRKCLEKSSKLYLYMSL